MVKKCQFNYMKRTKIEQLLVAIAWTGLIGGILFGTLVSKGIKQIKYT